MKKFLFVFIIFLLNVSVQSQTFEEFKTEFVRASEKSDFSERDLKMWNEKFSKLLENTIMGRNESGIKKDTVLDMLKEFKNRSDYQNAVHKLLNSNNSYRRILGYISIGLTQNNLLEDTLINRVKTEKNNDAKNVIYLSLMLLPTKYVSVIFDYFVDNEEALFRQLMPFYFRLNKDSIMNVAYSRIKDKNRTARVIAILSLSATTLNSKTDSILRNELKVGELDMLGGVIYSIKELRMGNLLELVKPLLKDEKLKNLVIEALSNSPTKEDRDFASQSVNSVSDSVTIEYLDGLFFSNKTQKLKLWLNTLCEKSIPDKYSFSSDDAPLIKSDELLPNILEAIPKVAKTRILSSLLYVLKDRRDSSSIKLLISYLDNENPAVRSWASFTLTGYSTQEFNIQITNAIKDKNKRQSVYLDLAINNNIENLKEAVEQIYKEETSLEWQRACIEYFSTFPKPEYRAIFERILKDTSAEYDKIALAAIGLSKFKDEKNVDIIIRHLKWYSGFNDGYATNFLKALSNIKCEKSKKAILEFRDSTVDSIREQVAQILEKW